MYGSRPTESTNIVVSYTLSIYEYYSLKISFIYLFFIYWILINIWYLAQVGAINSYRQEGESCGMGVAKNYGQCRPDLECVFGAMEVVGTCKVKSKHKDKLCFTS